MASTITAAKTDVKILKNAFFIFHPPFRANPSAFKPRNIYEFQTGI